MKMTTAIIITLIGLCITGFGVFKMVQASKMIKEANAKLRQDSYPLLPINDESFLDTPEKKYLFKEYVVSLFDKQYFEIIEWESDKIAKDEDVSTSNSYLDVKLNIKVFTHRFAVVCKYSSICQPDGTVKWIYRKNQELALSLKDMPVFIALGLFGTADEPYNLYIIPLSGIESEYLALTQLKPYLKEKGSKFFYDKGVLK